MPNSQEIIDLEKKAWEINTNHNFAAADELIDPDWWAVSPSGHRVSRSQSLALSRHFSVVSYDIEDPNVVFTGEDLAILRYEVSYSVKIFDGKLQSFLGIPQQVWNSCVCSVWIRRAGGWKQLSYQETPVQKDLLMRLATRTAELVA